jgi:threonine dehydrogenase-like Zn-dependent dehydrogenase
MGACMSRVLADLLARPAPVPPPRESAVGRSLATAACLAIVFGWAGRVVELRPLELVRDAGNIAVFLRGYLNCAGATMAAVVEAAEVGVGDCVVIQGLGALGLRGVALARAAGAGTVIGLDTGEDRLAMTSRFGADLVRRAGASSLDQLRARVAERSQSGGADAVIETSGVCGALQEGLSLLRPGGRYVTAGLVLPVAPVELDASLLVRGMITLRGEHNYQPRHLASAVDFAGRGRDAAPFGELVGARMPLDALGEAFAHAAARRSVRTAIVP